MKNQFSKLAALALFASLALPFAAGAADSSSMTVSATVLGTCKFLATPDAALGELDATAGGDVAITAAVQFWCTKNSACTLNLDDGANYGAGSRQMKGPTASDRIPYSLAPSSTSGVGAGKAAPVTVNIVVKVLGVSYRNAVVGDYSDVVQLTVTP